MRFAVTFGLQPGRLVISSAVGAASETATSMATVRIFIIIFKSESGAVNRAASKKYAKRGS